MPLPRLPLSPCCPSCTPKMWGLALHFFGMSQHAPAPCPSCAFTWTCIMHTRTHHPTPVLSWPTAWMCLRTHAGPPPHKPPSGRGKHLTPPLPRLDVATTTPTQRAQRGLSSLLWRPRIFCRRPWMVVRWLGWPGYVDRYVLVSSVLIPVGSS